MSEGALILAAPGWRVCVWSTEQGSVIALEIVAWEQVEFGSPLRPLVLTEFGEIVEPFRNDEWFVAIMPPGSQLIDFIDAGEQVAQAQREAEEREYARRQAEREMEDKS